MGAGSSRRGSGAAAPAREVHGSVRRKQGAVRLPQSKSLEAVYTLDEHVIGRGHFGVVRKCTNRTTQEVCACKAISKKRICPPPASHSGSADAESAAAGPY
mmetsp:Transcript_7751/g.27518  ORF Transcript_7751/g.27518 Transcript_7751/m.27518 type:complete len:101 (+) Transcript_7751:90-392(+)